MSERTSQLVRSAQTQLRDDSTSSRLLPPAVAGVCCFLIAVLMGTLSWYLFWLPSKRVAAGSIPATSENPVIAPEPSPSTAEAPEPIAETPPPPAGSVNVPGGEVVLAGSTNRPIERVFVHRFAIAET